MHTQTNSTIFWIPKKRGNYLPLWFSATTSIFYLNSARPAITGETLSPSSCLLCFVLFHLRFYLFIICTERVSIFKYLEIGWSNKKRVGVASAAPSLPFSPPFSSPTIALCASRSFNHKGATGNFLMSLYCRHTVPPTLSRSFSPAGNHHPTLGGDGAHVATDKPLWSISWMHSESSEQKALKIKPRPRCAQQWLCGQRCQRQPENIKEAGAAGLSVLNTN